MDETRNIWLLVNARSGSNNAAALEAVHAACGDNGFAVARLISFPDDELPTAAELDAADIAEIAIFTGDGTLNAAVTRLYGWSGSIIVLPGGTMNLLSLRLHGDNDMSTILKRIADGACRRVRPQAARCEEGDALAGLLVGPGTAWANVREAMRDFDVAGVAQHAGEAVAKTTGAALARCADPVAGHAEGYPLIEVTPSHRGMQLDGFRAEDAGEFLQQSWALLRRNFREGPHDRLGLLDEVTIENMAGEPLEVLIDGEPATLPARATFKVAACEVDLLATHHGF